MNKTKINFSVSVLSLLFVTTLIFAGSVKAQTSSTTFPVDEAGIAAYVKLDSMNIVKLTDALNHFYSIEEQGKTYIIGVVRIINSAPPGGQWYDCNTSWYNYPHLYIGLDGWVVAYYLKTEEASRVMQWKNYVSGTITTTILKDAIDKISLDISATYSDPIKYYDFEFPEANKITIIVETSLSSPNSFSVTVPGTLFEASYSLCGRSGNPGWTGWYEGIISLKVDGTDVFNNSLSCSGYGYYDISSYFQANFPHLVTLYDNYGQSNAATVLIYKN